MATVLVTGGTGTLGRRVVARLTEAGVAVRVLSRTPRAADSSCVEGDLTTGSGVVAALGSVEVIVHCATDPRERGADERATANLIQAARATASPPRLVYISIVGVDRVPLAYYRTKLATERLVAGSGLAWTTLRTTQFHDLIAGLAQPVSWSPIMPVLARTSFQPIDADEVAQRLVELTGEPARGRVDDMGGPEVRPFADLVRIYLRSVGRRRLLLPLAVPGAVARGYREGGHLAPDHAVGRVTFAQFCARRAAQRG